MPGSGVNCFSTGGRPNRLAGQLRDARQPEASNVNRILDDAVVNQPASRKEPAVPAEASPHPHRIHSGKSFQKPRLGEDQFPVIRRELSEQIPERCGPDHPGLHFFFLLLLARRNSRSTSSCVYKRPSRIAFSDSAIMR